MSKLLGVMLVMTAIITATLVTGGQSQPGEEEIVNEKVSSLLLMQVDLREAQIAAPTADRLERMQSMGIRTEDLTSQRIFIDFEHEPTQSQLAELQDLGITVYVDSWLPRVVAPPTGFMLADMPIDKLYDLAARDYVIRLNTAEQLLQPYAEG